ncbi:hypothetical protein [Burkholderia pseudomallei]|uniref:hypothetical protein n=2 Tax=Burkholderia pseudomallei TaxID=28450 RepID=UPI001EF28E6B|nr:hypothetical protein [Burkholderia pseudomallei]
MMTGPSDSNTKPSIALRSSRTLPDHGQSSRRAYASSSNCLGGRPWRSHSRASQYAISDGKSSMRSRRSGIDAAVTAIRWKRSIRNIPFAIAFFRSRWVSMRAPRETRLSMPLAAIRSRVSSGLPRRRADAERDSSDGGHSQGSADDAPMVTADTRALGHSGTQALRRFTAAEPPAAGHIKVHGGIGSSIAARPIHARIKTPRFGGQMESGYNCASVASMRSIAH